MHIYDIVYNIICMMWLGYLMIFPLCYYFIFPPGPSLLLGRAWLYVALNEQAMESYIRMFIENQDVAQDYYLR